MKQFIGTVCCVFIMAFSATAQYVAIPDASFRTYLKNNYPECFNSADMMDTTCNRIVTDTVLHIPDVDDITGVRYFKGLRDLDLSDIHARIIPALPDSLETLRFYYNSYLDSFAVPLPVTLQTLTIVGGGMRSLPEPLPAALSTLHMEVCNSILTLQALPANLKSLTFSNARLNALPVLPLQLTYLNCSTNNLSVLPQLPATLKHLDCSSNWILSTLPDLPDSLKFLNCNTNVIAALPLLPSGLISLNCSGNALHDLPTLATGNLSILSCGGNTIDLLPALPNSLKLLECNANRLTTLPVLPNGLRLLNCSFNPLHILGRLPDSLTTLDCSSDSLSLLPVLPAPLDTLSCHSNLLTSLPALPSSLRVLACASNNLTSLPALPASLLLLICANNNILSLPDLPASLGVLACSYNHITSLPTLPSITGYDNYLHVDCDNNDIYCLPKLPDNIWLTMDDKILCIPNRPANSEIRIYGSGGLVQLPLCNPTNNVYRCESFPVMSGHAFYDYNNNGVRDAGELVKRNLTVSLSNNRTTFTNNAGYFEIGADSLGSYTITPVAPTYYNIMPSSTTYNFTSYDTIVAKDYALQATASVDSLSIRIIPLNWAARPGFGFPYQISYENLGTTILNPNITFQYDSTRLIYNSVSNLSVVHSNNTLSLSETNFTPGETGSFIGYFRIKPTTPLHDSIHANATIAAGLYSVTNTSSVEVGGAFDPNDKRATPELSPAQVAAGEYIEYTIRFQNTGTDTAFNVVLSDTLNSKLQPATLQMLESSHNCKTTVKGNVIFFEFLNILLADSNVNEPKSHGFVTFRMKPQPNVAINSSIPNKAAIYFDYNAPVITNTAITLIRNPVIAPVPLNLMAFTATKQTDRLATAYWTTANEINVYRFIIEQSIDGSNFSTNAIQQANGRSYNTYSKAVTIPLADVVYLRLRMEDVDGRFTYSPVVVLKKNKSADAFTILNNPVKGNLIIAVADDGLMNTPASIINSQGVIVKTVVLKSNQQMISTDNLPAGVYILKTSVGSSQFILRK